MFRIISIPSKTFYFCLPIHVILMECKALDLRCQCTQRKLQSISGVLTLLNLKIFFYIFCKWQISVKLFYLYQRLQYTDNYFFKIKFALFLYLLLSTSWKENDLFWYISVIRQTVGYRTSVFTQPFSYYNYLYLPHLWLWYVDVVTVIA